MSTHTSELRYERELAARDAADQLLDIIAQLERAAILLVQAGQPSLHHRTRTVQAAAERLQTDVAGAIGDLVRERVVEDLSRRPERSADTAPTLHVA
jgi:hypothetical protein